MKIANGLKYIALALLTFSLISTSSVYFQLRRMENDSRVVNYAGIVRGGTQRLVKLELAGKPSDELAAKLDKIIKGLITGNGELGLPPATDPAFLARMNEVAQAWSALNQKLLTARSTVGQRTELLQASEEYFDLTNKAVGAAEAYSKGKVTAVIVLQFALLILNMLILASIWFLSERKIARPLTEVTRQLGVIAEGNLAVAIRVASNDEIGQLSAAMRSMVDKLKSMFLQIQKAADDVSGSSNTLSRFSDEMSRGVGHTSERSNTVAAASEEMSANMRAVAMTMEQSTANVNTVASSTEELTSTIREIATDSERARTIMGDTVSQVNALSERVNELGRSAQDIGKITETISAISAQTNLLALNATIEAARAGTAGKGFAVVANEIKELARQTATATEDIKNKIETIQSTTTMNVTDIGRITGVIREVYDIIANVASLIDMQSTAIKDIAKNIAQTAQGIHEVNGNVAQSSIAADTVAQDIAEVNRSSGEISSVSRQVKENAAELAALSRQMEGLIIQFKV
jgi:methyl-accepting chemotaxis protein